MKIATSLWLATKTILAMLKKLFTSRLTRAAQGP